MKKTILVVALLCFTVFATAFLHRVYADAGSELVKLKSELKQEGWVPKEVGSVEKSAGQMLKSGASRDQLRKVLVDLKNKGVMGRDLKKSADSMNDLVKAGETPKEAGNIVSAAAHNAKARGLKGKELAAKVHEAIRERKAQREALKKAKKEEKKTKKKWWEGGKKSAVEEVGEEREKAKSKWWGMGKEAGEEIDAAGGKGKGRNKK